MAQAAAGQKRFGTFGGVFTPSILTILGVILYLRFGWVVGNVGLLGTLLIVTISHVISLTTGFSVASISTNRTVGAGGAYFMISRSLGAPSGAAIGIPLFFGQALSVAFYVVGFTESLQVIWPDLPVRLVGSVVCLLLTLLSMKSAEAAIKFQFVIMAAIVLSLGSMLFGSPVEPTPYTPMYNSGGASFAMVFAVFFPAVTGIMAGVSMSGDLKDARVAIPKGTLWAIGVGFLIYFMAPFWFTHVASGETLMTDKTIAIRASAIPALVYLGIWGATLSSALGSIMTAPRTLQALASDDLAPKIFADGHGPANEPRTGLWFTFILAELGILLGSLDAIAPILTMFFLATYGFTNLACGLEKWAASPSFRPTFKVPTWISFVGAIACFYVMSIIDLGAMIGAMVICGIIYAVIERRTLDTTYGDARHAIWAALVRTALHKLRDSGYHPINWRPNLLILGGNPEKRSYLLQLGSTLVQDRGIVTYFHLLEGSVSDKAELRKRLLTGLEERLRDRFPNVFYRVDIAQSKYEGAVSAAQSYGLGTFESNTLLMGWPSQTKDSEPYFQMLRDLLALDRSLFVVRYDTARKFGNRKTIHIWWSGFQGNGGMMLLLAFLLTASDAWRNADVEVMMVVNSKRARLRAETGLKTILKQARLRAKPKVLLRENRAISEIIKDESAEADLAIMGIRVPDSDEKVVEFMDRTNDLLQYLPTTILVHSARDFHGEPVLLDPEVTGEMKNPDAEKK